MYMLYKVLSLTPSSPTTDTHQVIDAQEEGLNAPVALAIPAGCDAQIYPHQLRQELEGEAAQAVFRAPVHLKQLVADRLQQLDGEGWGISKCIQVNVKR